jgi:hypothetical protein
MNKFLSVILVVFILTLLCLGIVLFKSSNFDDFEWEDKLKLHALPIRGNYDPLLDNPFNDAIDPNLTKPTKLLPTEDLVMPMITPFRSNTNLPKIMIDNNEYGVLIAPSLRNLGEDWQNEPNARTNFTMPLPDGKEIEIEVERFTAIGVSGGEFLGSVKGRPGSRVKLTYQGDSEAGWIHFPMENRLIRILPSKDGAFYFHEVPPEDIIEGNTHPSFIPSR